MQAQELRSLTDSVAHAVSRDATRGAICYVRLEPDPVDTGHMLAVATDGHRIAVAKGESNLASFPVLAEPKGLASLPKTRPKGGHEQIRVSNGTPGVYTLSAGAGSALCYQENITLDMLNGGQLEYPNWRAVMPKSREATGTLRFTDGALEILAGMSHVSINAKLACEQRGESDPVVAVYQAATGYAARLELGAWQGKPFQPFGMNPSYLCDALGFARVAGIVQIQISDPRSPVLFGDSADYTAVMPQRL